MHPPTPEQQLIIEAARTTCDNLLVNALAGAAKTTTLEMICGVIRDIPILSLAFNRRIADEMSKRLPPHVECRTMNALGHRVWGAAIGRRLIVDSNKMNGILRGLIKELTRKEQEEAWEDFADTLKWLRAAKRDGYIPPKWQGLALAYSVAAPDWLEPYPEEPTRNQFDLINAALSASIEAAYAGGIDFDDQIFMPVCFGGKWPQFPLVLIDEFQDLNELQHEMLSKLATTRLIGVGDPYQSIYGFRGAKQNGMLAARDRWNMRTLTLSTTFRVPVEGVKRAWSRVPHMKWREGAPEGQIIRLEEWSEDNVPDYSAIICRNNAPLFSCALRLLSRGRSIKLIGMDIGPNLVRILKKLGQPDLKHAGIDAALEAWARTELRRAKREETVYEKWECLKVLCDGHETLGAAIRATEDLFKRDGPIQLLSGHKAKGLEWETVIHLDPWRVPSKWAKPDTEEWEQELNVKYVIESRFKEMLVLADMEGFV